MPEFKINGRMVGCKHPPYIVAELSANHSGSIEKAMQLITIAKSSGADAVKLQTYKPDTITLNCNNPEFIIEGGLWHGRTLYELYEEAHTPWEWHAPMFEYAKKIDITLFSSPFDRSAVDLLEDLNAPAYKIASFEAIDLPLIKYVASTHKPMIISTGMANDEEITEAINAAKEGGCENLAILHCVSGYPAPSEDYNLRIIPDMIKRFNLVTGLSDHTIDNTAAITSIALGTSIIEKHLTLDRLAGGPDDSFSLEPSGMSDLCKKTLAAWQALGKVDYGLKSSERSNIAYRRSLYFIKDIAKGEVITKDAIRSIRPGHGLPPKNLDQLVGKVSSRSIQKNTPTLLDDLLK